MVGVCLLENERWCDSTDVSVKKRVSTDLKLLSESRRPRCLPCDFGRIFVTVVCAAVFDRASGARVCMVQEPLFYCG